MDIRIEKVRHAWPVPANFTINRPKGRSDDYTFLHFHHPVKILVDGKVINAPPGSWIIYRPLTPQWFHAPQPMKHDWMHLTGPIEPLLLEAGLQPDHLYTPIRSSFVTQITRVIEQEHFACPHGHQLMKQLKFRELVLLLGRSCNQNPPEVKPAMERQLLQAREEIFSGLGKNWTVEKMAALCYLSASRFHNVYRSMFGISPTEDLIHARIENAKTRLAGSTETIHAIADSLGYKNVTHFCRQFRDRTGITPTQYREEN